MVILQRVLGVILGVFFLLAVLVFASVAFGIILAVGLVAWAWLWWKGRSLRKQAPSAGAVIEGEFRDVSANERLEELRRR